MIDLYTWATPNGRKISVMLEEVGLPYRVHPVDISQNQQFTSEYLAINPNNKIPAIIDQDGPDGQPLTVIESGAILIYLAEKTGQLLPSDPRGRSETLQWLMFQVASFGPMIGQAHHFRIYAPEKVPYGIKRYSDEAVRLYTVLNQRLSMVEFMAGAYSIADIAMYPWVTRHEGHGIALENYPHVQRWAATLAARPAVQRGLVVPA